MKILTKEQIIKIHKICIKKSGGSYEIFDEGLLDSAIQSPFQTFGGIDLYPDIIDKAAQLCYSIINNHTFRDGNKRVGVLAMVTFLAINNIIIKCTDENLIKLGLEVACDKMNSEDIKIWIKTNMREV